MNAVVVLVLSYLLGSVPFGYLAGKIKGVDIRSGGSGNIGATNTLRLLGPAAGATVLVLDVLKGVGAAWMGLNLAQPGGPWLGVAAGLFSVFGHNWSVFLGFKGGKGVATSFGFALYLMTLPSLVGFGTFLLVVAVTRYVSLGSILGALGVLVAAAVTAQPLPYMILTVLALAFIVARHRSNLERLRQGKENRLELGVSRQSRGRD